MASRVQRWYPKISAPWCKILSLWCRQNHDEVTNAFFELIQMGLSVGTDPVKEPLKELSSSWSQRFESQEGVEGWAVNWKELCMAPWSCGHFPVHNQQQCEPSAVNCTDMNSTNAQCGPSSPSGAPDKEEANTLISIFSKGPR